MADFSSDMRAFIFVLSALLLSACSSPMDALSEHFRNMGEIAISNASHCDSMARGLDTYMSQHEEEIRQTLRHLEAVSPENMQNAFDASTRLNYATAHCVSSEMQLVRRRLLGILLPAVEEQSM